MADFYSSVKNIFRNEGGFVDHLDDKGGPTNKGIILANWQKFGRDLDNDGDIDVEDLKRISDQDAMIIYKTQFWDKIRASEIKNQYVADILFDHYVNAPYSAVRIMQKVLNDLGTNPKLVVDGIVGPKTLSAINSYLDQERLHDEYKKARKYYYSYRASVMNFVPQEWMLFFKNLGILALENQRVFWNGWINRVRKFPDLKKK